MKKNQMKVEFDSLSSNEGFARVTVAAFMTQLNPTLEEISDVKTAVSEAVTNSIIHGYEGKVGTIIMECTIEDDTISIIIKDNGCGIENISRAMEPMYTSKPQMERSGMGFSFMEAFMDELEVKTELNKGTAVHMKKIIGKEY